MSQLFSGKDSFWKFDGLFTKKLFYHQGFFAVKRRVVFILGAKWIALVRGWRRDCVVGGMETRFQWRKAHSRSAKCEAFHVAPRLFFMFLFLVPFTIRPHCLILPPQVKKHRGWVAWGCAAQPLGYCFGRNGGGSTLHSLCRRRNRKFSLSKPNA